MGRVTLSVPRPTASAPDDTADLRVVPARYPLRWAGIAVVLVLLAQFVHGLATNPGWDWPTFATFFASGAVVTALGVTLQLTAYATVLGFAVGAVLALMRLSHSRFLRTVAWGYVWAFRSIPLIVQIIFWFNVSYLYPKLGFGIPFGPVFFAVPTQDLFSPLGAAVVGLTLTRPPTRPRSSAPACSPSTAASCRRPPRSASPGGASSGESCCRKPCARYCPTPPTR